MTEVNWAGNYTYSAERVHRPSTLEQLREIVVSAPRVRVLGSRHSFSDIADSTELVTLAGLPADVVVERAAGTVSFGAGMTYGDLAGLLWREGFALHNMASLPTSQSRAPSQPPPTVRATPAATLRRLSRAWR